MQEQGDLLHCIHQIKHRHGQRLSTIVDSMDHNKSKHEWFDTDDLNVSAGSPGRSEVHKARYRLAQCADDPRVDIALPY